MTLERRTRHRIARRLALVSAMVGLGLACAPILGIDDVSYGPAPIGPEGGGDGSSVEPGDGAAPCEGARLRCGALCVNPLDDPKNCGECGFDCGGAQCVQRECQPQVLASGQHSPHSVTTDGEYVYVTLYGKDWPAEGPVGSLVRFSLDGGLPEGGEPQQLASNLVLPSFVVLHKGRLVWTNKAGLMSTLPDGGDLLTNPDAGRTFGLTVDGDIVYAAALDSCVVHAWRVPPSSGPVPPPRAIPCGRWVAAGGGTLFASVTRDSDAGVSAFAADGTGAVARLGTAPSWALTVSGDDVFYSEELASSKTEDVPTRLVRIQRDGGGETTLTDGLYQPRVIAVDREGGFIYVGEFYGNQISRVPIDGGVPTVVAKVPAPVGLELRDGFLYWAGIGTPAQPNGQVGRIRVRRATP